MMVRTTTTSQHPDGSSSRQISITSSSSTISENMAADHKQQEEMKQTTDSLLNSEVSITKILNSLLAVPANRSCADCRSPLLDSSQVHASLSPVVTTGGTIFNHYDPYHRSKSDYGNFFANHQAFAPPGHQPQPPKTKDLFVDPAIVATDNVGGHGVFLCAMCGAAHKILGTNIAIVHSVQDSTAWTREEVSLLVERGGNERSWQILEAFMPDSWQNAYRPNNKSSLAEREIFCRAKYEALAFVLPPTGPRASRSWSSIVQKHQELQRWAKGELGSMYKLTLPEMRSGKSAAESTDKFVLPSRLVDFFCVVGCSKRLERSELKRDLSKLSSPEELYLETKVLDCFPDQGFYDDTEFPDHLFSIVLPDGCRPGQMQTPTFFSFVLTESSGVCLYGATLHIYDEALETQQLRNIILDSGYEGSLPTWLEDRASMPPAKQPPEIMFLPKCLVVLSHYPFFDLWRKFLLKLYRITLVEAPLSIERYIANFVCEIPLPPQGHIEIRCGFTNDDNWIISRPAPNQLPLANFSFKPLFASLSVGNIMVVTALLMQEAQVALVSQHYALLGVVAESLLSLLFPFQWLGLYAPCVPSRAMHDILEAPLPFLVGLHSSYLSSMKPKQRPRGVVFVDLDRDVVHLGFHPETTAQRGVPALPERDAAKLKSKLEEFGGGMYLVPDSGWKGSITTGDGDRLENINREAYAQMSLVDMAACKIRRKDVLGRLDKAFPDNEELTEMGEFFSEHGQLKERDETHRSDPGSGAKVMQLRFLRRLRGVGFHADDPKDKLDSRSLLDIEEPEGFSSEEIRRAYLRFFVTIFRNYATFLRPGAKFDAEAFLSDLNLPPTSGEFVRSILETQMFQQFLEDRRANPNESHFRFFDESIVAKNNRSKRTTIATGGKKGTPFLDDVSAKITDTFTPPPPSNWGLPDNGTGYTYLSFPSLNKEMIGKVRNPKHFPQHRSSLSRKNPTASITESKLLNGTPSFKPTTFSPPDRVSKRQVADLESAIKTLAIVHERRPMSFLEGLEQTGVSKKSSWGTESFESVMLPNITDLAEDFILCARRKQGVLLSFVVELQAYCRMLRARRQYYLLRISIMSLQRRFRDEPKVRRAKMQLLLKLQKAVLLQKNLRALIVRQRFKEKLQAIRNVQRWIRGVTTLHMFRRLRSCVISIQARVRGRRIRFAMYLLSNLLTVAQARIRGFVTRRRFLFVMNARMEMYKNQVFLLWQHAHTPLSHRTTFWYIFKECSYLNTNLVEDELIRLWDELQIKLSPQAGQTKRLSTTVLVEGEKLGLQNETWRNFLVVELMLSEGGQSNKDVIFPAEAKSSITSAAAREQAERLQLYERLRRCNDQELLKRAYNKFNIPTNQKLKKKCLSVAVFTTYDNVEQSVFVIQSFFPELEGSANITWIPPSKRGFKRLGMMISNFIPLEKSTGIQKRIEGRIRSDLKHMAASLMSGCVYRLIVKLDAREQRRLKAHESQQQAMLESHNFSTWSLCRRHFLQGQLIPHLTLDGSSPQNPRSRPTKRNEARVKGDKILPVPVNADETINDSEFDKTSEAVIPAEAVEVVLCNDIESSKPIFPDEAFASIDAVNTNFPAEAYNLL